MQTKKVLIITYYWPPAGGPGVQRWLKFVKYLPEFGIEPIVYVPENPTYPIVDDHLIEEVNKNTIILKNKIVEPYQLAGFFSKNKAKKISSGIIPKSKNQTFFEKIMLWIRGNIFIPDARFLWVKPSVSYLEKYITDNLIDTIITTGPPHSVHLIGLHLKSKTKVRWFADFRDPWTTIGYHKALKLSNYAQKKHRYLEKKVLNSADSIIVTSKTTKKEFEQLTHKPIEVITNGFDVENIEKQTLDTTFSLAHIGSFLSERNPKILWESLRELCNEIPHFKSFLEIKLIGAVSQDILDEIKQHELLHYTINMGYVDHQDALKHQRKSQILLLIEIDSEDTKSILPGKLFEYMVSERPIIAIGPKDSDFEALLIQTNTGVFFQYNEKMALKYTIAQYFDAFLKQNLKSNAIGLHQFSRKQLTEKLSKLIHNQT
ncbi:glycosyltransferase family 4 protein [Flavobacterium branchiophilum]|uniref:Glycosyl transferase family 1 n=1 Tax=Flavobacterium branchiophilum TaxID=55197 RepID=A0A2H3KC06_9FLAO|nr:glycosyltransferase family 4 protein [Flavobacterium branchiophilum]PDS24783.1 glycosyl transferase family 1 [Flavobacterium branchiophilum]